MSAIAARLSGSVTTIQRQFCSLLAVGAWIARRRHSTMTSRSTGRVRSSRRRTALVVESTSSTAEISTASRPYLQIGLSRYFSILDCVAAREWYLHAHFEIRTCQDVAYDGGPGARQPGNRRSVGPGRRGTRSRRRGAAFPAGVRCAPAGWLAGHLPALPGLAGGRAHKVRG